MKRGRFAVAGVLAALLAFGPAAGRAADHLFYLSMPDLGQTYADYSATPVKRLTDAVRQTGATDPDFQTFVTAWRQMEQELGFSLAPAALMGGVFADLNLSILPGAEPGMLLTARLNDPQKAATLFGYLRGRIQQSRPDIQVSASPHGGAEIVQFQQSDGSSFFAGLTADAFVFSTSQAMAMAGMDGQASVSAPSGAAAETIGRLKTADRDITAYLDVQALNQLLSVASFLAPEAGPSLQLLTTQLRGMKSMAFGGAISPREMVFETVMPMDAGQLDPLMAGVVRAPEALPGLRYAPQDAWIASALNSFDLKAQLDMMRRAIATGDPMAAATFDQNIAQFEAATGLSINGDIAPAVGGNVVFALNNLNPLGLLMGDASATTLDVTLGVQIADSAKMQTVISRLEALAQQNFGPLLAQAGSSPDQLFEDDLHEGARIRTARIPNMPISPSYAIDGDFLLFNTTKENVMRALDLKNGGASAASLPALTSLQQRFGHPDSNVVSLISFTDLVGKGGSLILPTLQWQSSQSPEMAAAFGNAFSALQSMGTLASSQRWDGQANHAAAVMTFAPRP